VKFIFILLSSFLCFPAFCQTNAQNPFGLPVISTTSAYKASIKADKNKRLIDIKKTIPGIVLDIRYATKNNFMKQVMYPEAKAFARAPVVEQLKRIQLELLKKGYGLKIYDGYRPYAITRAFYKKASDKAFVADPAKGSKHNRGCAIDLSLIDFKTKKEIPMPTPYDSFAPQAAVNYPNLPTAVLKNRAFLIQIMQAHGFRVIKNEWWHFDFIGWQNYELMDLPFSTL
jgi:D-alanyl-D-alanine dipeptidase